MTPSLSDMRIIIISGLWNNVVVIRKIPGIAGMCGLPYGGQYAYIRMACGIVMLQGLALWGVYGESTKETFLSEP